VGAKIEFGNYEWTEDSSIMTTENNVKVSGRQSVQGSCGIMR
jgi:hypothetical protein